MDHLVYISLETAPWLVVGLLAAGLIHAWMPEGLVNRWLGGEGIMPVIRAAFIGAPLPLCSCSVIPMAMELRRNGASKASTVSFLVATPETGIDSIALSWILLGPLLTIIRPIAAILSGVFSGVLTLISLDVYTKNSQKFQQNSASLAAQPICSSRTCCQEKVLSEEQPSPWMRTWNGLWYAMNPLWNDIAPWLAIGLLLTALVQTVLPAGTLQVYSHGGWLGMLVMIVLSMPVYVCATASTPMAAAMLYSGLSPGMTLAFLIAGPATNLAPLAIIKREMGGITLSAYLLGILLSAMGLGLLTDWVASFWSFTPVTILVEGRSEWIPLWLATTSALLLISLSMHTMWLTFQPKLYLK